MEYIGLFSKSIRLRLLSHADELEAKQWTVLVSTWKATEFLEKTVANGLRAQIAGSTVSSNGKSTLIYNYIHIRINQQNCKDLVFFLMGFWISLFVDCILCSNLSKKEKRSGTVETIWICRTVKEWSKRSRRREDRLKLSI